jgi:hypothetical protein
MLSDREVDLALRHLRNDRDSISMAIEALERLNGIRNNGCGLKHLDAMLSVPERRDGVPYKRSNPRQLR